MSALLTAHLSLAVRDCLDGHTHASSRRVRPKRSDTTIAHVQARLWREDPERVAAAYDAHSLQELEGTPEGGHDRPARRMGGLRRPCLTRPKVGWPLRQIATHAGLPRETLAALMEHHGYIETVTCGGQQRRRLVTDTAFHAGVGHNADGGGRHIGFLEGHNRATLFPVFYPGAVSAILWTLNYQGLADHATSIPNKRQRLQWVMEHHGYLPDAEVARLARYSLQGVEKARGRLRARKLEAGQGVSAPLAPCRAGGAGEPSGAVRGPVGMNDNTHPQCMKVA